MYKRYFIYPPGYLVQGHLCFIVCLLAFGGKKGVLAEIIFA
jgi:hypothetical protein